LTILGWFGILEHQMNLYLLRHGLAVEPGTPGYSKDADRPLTPKGQRKLVQIARAMRALELEFDRILFSPYVRARGTAVIIAKELGLQKHLQSCDALTPSGTARKLIATINDLKPLPANVLLVGHEPCLSELASLLLSGETSLSITMKKGGLCMLTAESLRPGRCASLEWLLTPKQMTLSH
jgi:phosphohistidine phosphatase